MVEWKKKVDWVRFYQRIIDKNGNISLEDARECKFPDGIFAELCMRNIPPSKLVKFATDNMELAKKWEKKYGK